jgi:acetyltransferase-like isoleucine patch superfamily enzyme
VVARETEWQSSYVREDLVGGAVAALRRRHPEWQIVTVPRYEPHASVDVPGLLARADLLLGGGGTMCIEAAALGVPVLATRGRRVAYMDWLFDRGLATPCASEAEIVARAGPLVAERGSPEAEARRRRARRVFDALPFPLEAVLDAILATARGEAVASAAAPPAPGIDPTAYVHGHALVEDGARVGARTRVWAFAHLPPGARVGADCNVCDHVFVEDGAVVGDRVTLKTHVEVCRGATLEDDVFVGPGVRFTNDRRPRSRRPPPVWAETRLRRGCSIGANATLLPGIEVGAFALVGAGAVVCGDVPPHALVRGSPARRVGWVCRCGGALRDAAGPARCAECGAAWHVTPAGVTSLEDGAGAPRPRPAGPVA